MNSVVTSVFLSTLLLSAACTASTLDDISNFRQYSPAFASSGQPSKKQLRLLKDAGFERIVYIAFTNSGNAFDDEDQIVKELGMDYIQIPVDWEAPTISDFHAFAGAMQLGPEKKTLLHCQVNFRASAFSFLYRVLYQDVPVAEAKRDMNSVWQPNETWRDLIFSILEQHDVSPNCGGCDWTVSEMQH